MMALVPVFPPLENGENRLFLKAGNHFVPFSRPRPANSTTGNFACGRMRLLTAYPKGLPRCSKQTESQKADKYVGIFLHTSAVSDGEMGAIPFSIPFNFAFYKMSDTAALLLQLNDVEQILDIRTSIVDLMFKLLNRRQGALDAWETMHLANAVGALSLNVHALNQPTFAWLRLCINDLECALIPPDQHIASDLTRSMQRERPTYMELRNAIDAIAIEIGSSPDRTK